VIPPRIKSQAAKDRELSHAGFRLLCCLVDDRIRRGGELEDHFTLPWTLAARWLGCEEKAAYEAIGALCGTGYITKRGRKGVPPMQVFSFGPKSLQKGGIESPGKGGFKGPEKGGIKSPEKGGALTSYPFGKKADGNEGEEMHAAVAAGTLEEEESVGGAAVAGPHGGLVAVGPALEAWKKEHGL
jgi:hypothetical protein